MTEQDAFRSQKHLDIIYDVPDPGEATPKFRKPKPVNRKTQGAYLSGHTIVWNSICPECEDQVGHLTEAAAKLAEDFGLKCKRCEKQQKDVDTTHEPEVDFETSDGVASPRKDAKPMVTLTLKGINKKNTAAIYTGARTAIRFPLTNFEGKTAPQTLILEGDGFAGPAAPRVKLTPEERKAKRAAQPKPTAAEIIAKKEAQLAKLKAKLEAQANGGDQSGM